MTLSSVLHAAGSALMPKACVGCHSEARMEPPGRFPTGFGRWSDAQCFGCHQEFNEVGEQFAKGVRDKRYYSLPIRDERLKALAQNPLPYTHAPLRISWDKYDPARLLEFLKRPTGFPSRMPAFPEMSAQDFSFLKARPASSGNARRGESLFQAACVSCHALSEPFSGRTALQLSLYSSEWIFQYATGRAQTRERSMPRVQLSASDAEDVFAYLGELQQRMAARLDQAVAEIKAPTMERREVPQAITIYMENRFFRDGGCVHCHGIEGRARDKLNTSPEGLRTWLQNNDPLELWRRLEIRALEEKAGLGAGKPGMPMTGPALPQPMRTMLLTWIQGGCPNSKSETLCGRSSVSMKKGGRE